MTGATEIDKRYYLNVGKALNIEIPEVEHPDKLVTLELLSQDTKKSLNYDVEAFTKGVKITDHIHGEANVIIKYDLDGFTIYGFEEDNLMSKNATMDLDMWKQQAIDIMKSKQSDLTVASFQHLKETGDKTPKELHNFLVKEHKDLYEDVLESDVKKLKKWIVLRDGISEKDGKISADDDKIMQEEEIKKEDIKAVEGEYKTPPELREGEFKLYAREDDNLTLAIKLKTENMFWTIDIENEEEMFDLFGAAGKYPAEVAKTVTKGQVVDSGKIRLGIQRDGYHEYFLEGNKFETKMHYRVLDVNGEKMWLAWTGFKQTPADKEGDEGKWNIYEDRYNKLPLPTEE